MITNPKEPLNIVNLELANFRTTFLTDDITNWRDAAVIPTAMSCARQVWFGRACDFRGFPCDRDTIEFLYGGKAYAFLLKLITGMDSVKEGETVIAGQFNEGVRGFIDRAPEKAKLFDTFSQQLIADTRLVRREILENFQMHDESLVARSLSGQKKGESVLLVGKLSRHSTAKDVTLGKLSEGIAKVLAGPRKTCVKEIDVTNPDPKITADLKRGLENLKARGMLSKDVAIRTFEFEDFGLAAELYDRVYVDLPMGENPHADRIMTHGWADRLHEGNTLTHLCGEPKNRGQSRPEWLALRQSDNVILAEDIRERMAAIAARNKIISAQADKAFERCADIRLDGKMPAKRHLADIKADIPASDYAASVKADLKVTPDFHALSCG